MMSISMATPMTAQLYVHCRPEEIAATTAKMEHCIADMDYWMSANRLKLNMDKNITVNASQHVRVLGIHFSSDLTNTFLVSARSASIIFVNSDASGFR